MGNFTSIEAEFNRRLAPQANAIMQSPQNAANPQLAQNQINDLIKKTLFEMRKERMQALCDITGRNLICYMGRRSFRQNLHQTMVGNIHS